jgi:hypothetical protein
MKEEELRTRDIATREHVALGAYCYCVTQNFVKDYASNFDTG